MFFKKGSHWPGTLYLAQAGPELKILMLLSTECWDYTTMPGKKSMKGYNKMKKNCLLVECGDTCL
jgi:hypothetical protein